ncbi:nSTAND1 domain-containing NTPase [Mangrovicoccus ximenensis]|uniref:nSTAND1 domain-containing NTPase n=1 Tax=Mangrovicoccus ximenensis TaxID=1911570 RepID=UPI000D390E0D|nr:hypothetical protein [Mangrovicoccus ximenensis]
MFGQGRGGPAGRCRGPDGRGVAGCSGAGPWPEAAGGALLLNIDQGEELYTRAARAEAEHFSELIAGAAGTPGLSVIGSIRSDYYGALQDDRALFPLTKRIDVPPLGREAIEAVIRKPAALLGAEFDIPEIVPMLAEVTSHAAGGLPILRATVTPD